MFWSSLTWYHGPIEERGTDADIFLGELLVPHKIEKELYQQKIVKGHEEVVSKKQVKWEIVMKLLKPTSDQSITLNN